ncbi:uncharacterized protein LOC127879496 isoform X2 [Dreissena polymorpha]|uniref:uncharacterized protein LOC127879496 isoform X2 n=1 Tax=Dreissena polymorpha TaxID=45954 RepID=UPI0022652EE1|nr:uncharacterized protein LOC127879496 isoform X2 [Dreissena polymorpha]
MQSAVISGFLLLTVALTTSEACLDQQPNCDVLNTTFNVCKDLHTGTNLCRRYCGLCSVVHGGWSVWSAWGVCDVTCGNGTMARTRECNNPAPINGGDDCQGSKQTTGQCLLSTCPTHGGWSAWSEWGSCSVTCGVGLKRRDRVCDNPWPSRDGNHCFGDNINYEICFEPSCANWSSWENWSSCSNNCGHGLQKRTRSCVGSTNMLYSCSGSDEQYISCQTTCSEYTRNTTSAFTATGLQGVQEYPLVFPTILLNDGDDYNPISGEFTCRIAVLYFFVTSLTKTRESSRHIDGVYAYIQINGVNQVMTVVDPIDIADAGSYMAGTSGTFRLRKGDRVTVYGLSRWYTPAYCTFSGYLIKPDLWGKGATIVCILYIFQNCIFIMLSLGKLNINVDTQSEDLSCFGIVYITVHAFISVEKQVSVQIIRCVFLNKYI